MAMGRARGIAIMSVSVVFASACSVFSGWSDLQEGSRVDAGTGLGVVDSGGRDGSSSLGDARIEGGDLPPDGVPCGASRCAEGDGCCTFSSTQKQCSSASTCRNDQGLFLECTSRASCSFAGLDCCLSSEQPFEAICTTACPEQGKAILCDPTEPAPCSTGTCKVLPGNFGLNYCQ